MIVVTLSHLQACSSPYVIIQQAGTRTDSYRGITVQAIPKLLWDLGSVKPAVTHTALALLHTALRFAPEGSALSSALNSMQPQLCPFYCSLLAPKGSKGAAPVGKDGVRALKVVVPGPLAQLPTDSQVRLSHFSHRTVVSASRQSTLHMS